jgi:hypothetical protein
VYSKAPFGSAKAVLKYLARYTHRVAIGDKRIVAIGEETVSFRYRDRRAGETRTMTLAAGEFIRRFLLHVLPKGLHRIRYFGFMANRVRAENLVRLRALLGPPEIDEAEAEAADTGEPPAAQVRVCPACAVGQLMLVESLDRVAVAFIVWPRLLPNTS